MQITTYSELCDAVKNLCYLNRPFSFMHEGCQREAGCKSERVRPLYFIIHLEKLEIILTIQPRHFYSRT